MKAEVTSAPPSIPGLEPLITIDALSAYLGVPVKTIYDWRNKNKGPAAHRFGRHLMFAVCDVRAWIEQQRDPAPTAEP